MRIALLAPETQRAPSSPPSGGYLYDERLASELRALGHVVDELATPSPATASAEDLARTLLRYDAVLEDELGYRHYAGVNEVLRAAVGGPTVGAIVHVPEALLSPSPETIRRERAFLDALDAVFFVSETTLRDTAAILGPCSAAFVAAPGSDHFRPASASPGETFHVVAVGRLHPHKEVWDLVRTLEALDALDAGGGRRWHATIVGHATDAAYASAIEAHVAGSRFASCVTFAGHRSHGEIAELLATAHVLLSTSRYESYCIAAAEALMSGVPVVGSARGGFRELVRHGETGVVVEPGDIGGLARALGQLRDDAALQRAFATRAREAGASLPTWRETAERVGRTLANGVRRGSGRHDGG